MPNNNNDLVNRPFADLQERLDSVSRLDRETDQITNRRETSLKIDENLEKFKENQKY